MAGSARKAAYRALFDVERRSAMSSAAADRAVRAEGLDRRDTSFAYRLIMGVLQNGDLLDRSIDQYLKSPKTELTVRIILRLGAYQILFTRVPARAAVSESVELCRTEGCPRAAGLVNAVLRRLAERPELPALPPEGTAEYLSARYSHPLWLAQRLISDLGYAQAEQYFEYDNSDPPLTVIVNTLRTTPELFRTRLESAGLEYSLPCDDERVISIPGCSPALLPGFSEGLFFVQDSAAFRAVKMAEPFPGAAVLDACAAPGGKSLASALLMGGSGSILSCDISAKKLSLIEESAERLGIGIITTCCLDASKPQSGLNGRFDVVLADVPCSGFGVIAKKPEIRRKSPTDVAGLSAVQRKIINNLSAYVKPGGVILYSTCTVLKEENEDVVNAFLDSHSDFKLEKIKTFLPSSDGTDGFFAALLRRVDQ